MAAEVILPRVDMDMEKGKITKWFVNEGESVAKGQPLFEIESDKAAMEIEASADGVLQGVTGKPGDEYPVGAIIGWILAPGETLDAMKPAPAAASGQAAEAPTAPLAQEPRKDAEPAAPVHKGPTPATPKARRLAREYEVPLQDVPGTGPNGRVQAQDVVAAAKAKSAKAAPAAVEASGIGALAGPAARHLADELSVDISKLQGTGEKGRVTKDDVKAAFEGRRSAATPTEAPLVDLDKYGPSEVAPLSRIKRISGPRLHASWVNIPHVTHCDEADITELERFRKSLDDAAKQDRNAPHRVSLLPLVMKCAVASLKAFPYFNAALLPSKDAVALRKYWHIGVAVDTQEGLVIAVVRDVDKKGINELASELTMLSAKARDGKLGPSEMQGATFTISSLGGIGGRSFTPIINAPEVAILGVVRAKMEPVWDGAAFQPRLMLPLCLSYDHRVIDGASAAKFVRHLSSMLEDARRVLV